MINQSTGNKLPLILRVNQTLLAIVLITGILYFGRIFLIPLIFAILFAMLMLPICRYFDRKGMHRGLSVFICVLILFFSFSIIAATITLQVLSFSEDLPEIKEKGDQFLTAIQGFTQEHFNISSERQSALIKKQMGNAGELVSTIVTGFFSSIAGLLTGIVLILVYTFLLLYNKERYEMFFLKIFQNEEDDHVKNLLQKIGNVSQQYLKGRVITILILSVLYSGGLLLVGIKHAILLGCIAALLTIIPYVGTLLGGLFPLIMALITGPSWESAVWVAVVMLLIQALDNYFLEPYFIGGEVNLSALATILALIAGGILWGIPGMILFIPLLGIGKIIFDNIEKLKPLGFLIGDPDHKSSRKKRWLKRKK